MTRRHAIGLALLGWATGCGGGSGGSALPAEIAAFVAGQSLPRARRESDVPVVDGVDLFEIQYSAAGSATAAMGLRYRSRIGWLWIDEQGLTTLERPRYRFNLEDGYLFTGDFLLHLKQAVADAVATSPDYHFAYEFLRDTIARSEQADHDALQRIAFDLYAEPAYILAETLVHNPKVRVDRDILTTLAGLTDPGYATARQEARDLLAGLP